MAEWLEQLRAKLIAHKERQDRLITAETAALIEADDYYRRAQISCLTWVIGLCNQAVDRRAAAADRRAAATAREYRELKGGR